jgi:hypothetical protein
VTELLANWFVPTALLAIADEVTELVDSCDDPTTPEFIVPSDAKLTSRKELRMSPQSPLSWPGIGKRCVISLAGSL